MAGEYAPSERPAGPDCTDRAAYGAASNLDQYITKQYLLAEEDYPADACPNRYYSRAKIDTFEITQNLTMGGNIAGGVNIACSGTVSGATGSFSVKPFNIPHPSPDKEGMRLVHACLEGPENGVYFRGRVTNKKEILLPPYWKDLVDWTTITVNLTPIGSHQSVIVKRFDEGKIYLQSNGGMPIDCFYHVYGTRKDIAPLPVEMEKDEPWPYS
ncbi:hypothetical protein SSM2_020 [Synechococcus phage S-SM2]|uniref:Uncharacterized protein n=1 Tax=Synechococcus phage S-SM2 TaxID=444860 RepID=E3SIR6_9CAUD|nr:hypothetical protein SSM2_020 [Synechococcus phage S-SM2]ADO97364.1 hypothetical protein SSM2_020 [Synechococcus phage S-SM2]